MSQCPIETEVVVAPMIAAVLLRPMKGHYRRRTSLCQPRCLEVFVVGPVNMYTWSGGCSGAYEWQSMQSIVVVLVPCPRCSKLFRWFDRGISSRNTRWTRKTGGSRNEYQRIRTRHTFHNFAARTQKHTKERLLTEPNGRKEKEGRKYQREGGSGVKSSALNGADTKIPNFISLHFNKARADDLSVDCHSFAGITTQMPLVSVHVMEALPAMRATTKDNNHAKSSLGGQQNVPIPRAEESHTAWCQAVGDCRALTL